MADKQQVIRLVYQADQATRDANKFDADEKRRLREQAAAAKQAAREIAEANDATAKKKIAAAKEATATETRMARDAARETARSAKDTSREEMNALRDKHRAAMLAWTAQQKANKDAAEAAAKAKRAQDAANNSTLEGVKAVGMMSVAMFGLGSASSVLGAITEKFENIRKAALEAARGVIDQQGDFRELAALQGQAGGVSAVQAQQLALRAKTLQTEHAALAMSSAAWTSGVGAVQQGLISKPEFEKSLVSAGKLQTLTGSDPTAVGRMAGMMPLITGKQQNTAEDIGKLQNQLYEIQRQGGFQSYGQSVEQLGQASPYVMKEVYTAPMAQALLSAFAFGGEGGKANEYLSQATRAVSAGLLRNRGIKPAEGYEQDMMKSAAYFKSLGVTTEQRPEERMMAVVKDVLANQDQAKAKGKYFNVMDFLLERGFVNQEDREALAKLAGVQKVGLLEPLMKMGRAEATEGGQADAAFAKAVGTEPFFQKEAANFAGTAAGMKVGAGPRGLNTFRETMETSAFNALGGRTHFGEPLAAFQDRAWWNPYNMVNNPRSEVELQAQTMILGEAGKAGLRTPDPFNRNAKTGEVTGQRFLGWEELFNLSEKTRGAGGAFAPGPDQARTNDVMEKFTSALENFTNSRAQPAAGGATPATAQPAIPIMPTPRPDGRQ